MDARFGTHEGIYEVLEQADRVPGLLDVSLGKWLAWPAAKIYVYARLFSAVFVPPRRTFRPRLLRTALAVNRMVPAFARFQAALRALPEGRSRSRVGWLVGTRPSRGPDGVIRDSVFDELPRDLAAHAEHLFLAPPVLTPGADGIQAQSAHDAAVRLAGALEPLQRHRPAIRSAAAAMAARLSTLTPSAADVPWEEMFIDALANFEARRLAWGMLFRSIRPKLLLTTDAAYFGGGVAAAKEAGVHVAEFQHGLFGPRCPEYGWPGTLSAAKDRMPVPNSLFLFGELFREGVLHNGFWRPEEVRVVGSAPLERHRRASSHGTGDAVAARRVLFFTQRTSREDAPRFWSEFLATMEQTGAVPLNAQSAERGSAGCSLTLKVHPDEQANAAEYRELAEQFPKFCTVAAPDADPLQLMCEHDLVASYTSNALIEAVGLGRPAVSLAGRQSPGGVFGLCPIPGAAGTIPTVSSPAEFVRLLKTLGPAPASAASLGFYADGSSGAVLESCLDLLNL